jgi:hypothetical protein
VCPDVAQQGETSPGKQVWHADHRLIDLSQTD